MFYKAHINIYKCEFYQRLKYQLSLSAYILIGSLDQNLRIFVKIYFKEISYQVWTGQNTPGVFQRFSNNF